MPDLRAFQKRIRRLGSVALLSALPQQAAAACDLAADLAGLHTAYSDLIEGGGTPRADIGRYVINRELITQSERDLVQSLTTSGFYESMPELRPVLDGMAALAQRGANAEDLAIHRSNVENLTRTLRSTGCFETPGPEVDEVLNTLSPNDTPPEPEDANPEASDSDVAGTGGYANVAAMITQNAPFSYIVLAVIALAASVSAWILRRVFFRNRARAFIRVPFGGPLPITDALGRRKDRIVVDVSQGGLMIERPTDANPDLFDHVSVQLPDGAHRLDLVWENEHFFGYQFVTHLTETAFEAVLAIDVKKTDDRHTTNENSAPEGAAQQPA